METTDKVIIDVHVTTIKKKEIALPYYSRREIFFYKVIDPLIAVQVNTSKLSGPEITKRETGAAFHDECDPCTELEFNNAFNETLARLNELTLSKLASIEHIDIVK